MIKEQRKSERHEGKSRLYYTFPGSQERVDGYCINLSNNGLSLESERQLEPERVLHVCLYSKNESAPQLAMLVKIIWSKKLDSGLYRAGTIIKAIMAANESTHV